MQFRIAFLGFLLIVGAALYTLPLRAEERSFPESFKFGNADQVLYNSSVAQSRIHSTQSLGELARANTSLTREGAAFGFAAKSSEAQFFLVGTYYAEALALARSNDMAGTAERLEAIEQMLIEQGAPSGLYSYISRTRHHAVRKDYSADVLVDYLSLFQPLFEDYAKSQSQDKLVLFQIGSWLVDMGLTAAAGDIRLLRQQVQLQHIVDAMRRMDAPSGVQNALTEIAEITQQDEISDRDADKVLRLVKKIQSTLG